MRQALRFLGNRYGAALALVVVIAVVVAFGKLAGGKSSPPTLGGGTGTISIATGTASLPPDDGVGSPPPVAAPSTSPGAADPQTVAIDFAQAWLNHTGVTAAQWHSGIAKYVTTEMSQKLIGVDPADVPASKVAGDLTVIDRAESYVDISVPLDSGTLVLRLIANQGRWLVDGVDWQRP
jgi:hypothetical protein